MAFDEPFLVVIEETNFNLDHEGEEALTTDIESVRQRECIAIAQHVRAIHKVLVLQSGCCKTFGVCYGLNDVKVPTSWSWTRAN